MLPQTVNIFVANRHCIVAAMICFLCFRSPHHERNQFPEDMESLLPFIVTARTMTECRVPTHESLLHALVENKHAHLSCILGIDLFLLNNKIEILLFYYS